MKICFLVLLLLCVGSISSASDTFSDVPGDHWASESVQAVADAGIMRGYPDDSFGGEKCVTRYELAVALANFVEYVRVADKPLVSSETELTICPPKHWADTSVEYLRAGGFIVEDSVLLTNGQALITQDDLARALASVGARLAALRATSNE